MCVCVCFPFPVVCQSIALLGLIGGVTNVCMCVCVCVNWGFLMTRLIAKIEHVFKTYHIHIKRKFVVVIIKYFNTGDVLEHKWRASLLLSCLKLQYGYMMNFACFFITCDGNNC